MNAQEAINIIESSLKEQDDFDRFLKEEFGETNPYGHSVALSIVLESAKLLHKHLNESFAEPVEEVEEC